MSNTINFGDGDQQNRNDESSWSSSSGVRLSSSDDASEAHMTPRASKYFVESLESEIQNLKDRNTRYAIEIGRQKALITDLQKQIIEYTKREEYLTNEVANLQRKDYELQEEMVKTLRQQREEMLSDVFGRKEDSTSKEIDIMKHKIRELNQELQAFKEREKGFIFEINRYKEREANHMQQFEEQQELRDLIDMYKRREESLMSEIKHMKKIELELNGEVEYYKEHEKKLKDTLQQQQQQQAQQSEAQQRSMIKKKSNNVYIQTVEIQKPITKNSETQTTDHPMTTHSFTQTFDIQSLQQKQKLQFALEEIEETKNENNKLRKLVEESKEQNAQMEQTFLKYQQAYKAQLERLQTENASLQVEIKLKTEQYERLATEHRQNLERMERTERVLSENKQAIIEQMEQLQRENNQFVEQVRTLEEENRKISEHVEYLQHEIMRKNEENAEIENTIVTKNELLERATVTISQLQQEVQTQAKQLKHYKKEYKQAKRDLKQARRIQDEMQQQFDRRKKEFETKVEKVERQLQEMRQKGAEELEAIRRQWQAAREAEQMQQQQQLQEEKSRNDAAKEEHERRNKEIMEFEINARVAEMKASLLRELELEKREFEIQLRSEMTAEMNAELKRAKERGEIEVREMRRKCEEDARDIKQMSENELREVKKESEAQLAKLQKTFNEEKAAWKEREVYLLKRIDDLYSWMEDLRKKNEQLLLENSKAKKKRDINIIHIPEREQPQRDTQKKRHHHNNGGAGAGSDDESPQEDETHRILKSLSKSADYRTKAKKDEAELAVERQWRKRIQQEIEELRKMKKAMYQRIWQQTKTILDNIIHIQNQNPSVNRGHEEEELRYHFAHCDDFDEQQRRREAAEFRYKHTLYLFRKNKINAMPLNACQRLLLDLCKAWDIYDVSLLLPVCQDAKSIIDKLSDLREVSKYPLGVVVAPTGTSSAGNNVVVGANNDGAAAGSGAAAFDSYSFR